MTWEERVGQVASLGFTDRQAGFLATVMFHAGVCVGRQYCTYAGMQYGGAMQDFFASLVARRYATLYRCGGRWARLYHLHHKGLYRAIGDVENRFRRPTGLPRAVERLMLLDAVLADRGRTWLGTERDKRLYFTLKRRIPRDALPSLTFRAEDSETVRCFAEKLPIGLDPDGRTHVFLYLLTQDVPIDFRAFLERHAELFRALPAWTIRLVVPSHKTRLISLYQAAFREQLTSPLRPLVLEELRWYFQARRARPKGNHERFDQAVRAFSPPRFRALYKAWLEHGEPVLRATLSTALQDAVARGTGRFEWQVLPHRYLHLLSLVGTA